MLIRLVDKRGRTQRHSAAKPQPKWSAGWQPALNDPPHKAGCQPALRHRDARSPRLAPLVNQPDKHGINYLQVAASFPIGWVQDRAQTVLFVFSVFFAANQLPLLGSSAGILHYPSYGVSGVVSLQRRSLPTDERSTPYRFRNGLR